MYGGDVSEPEGTVMHKDLLRKGQIRFCQSSFEEHLKKYKFLTNEKLMTSIFGPNLSSIELKEMLARICLNYFLGMIFKCSEEDVGS